MKAQWLAIWAQRTPRERALILLAAILALLALYASALAPLRRAGDAAEDRLRRAVADYRLMQRVRDSGVQPSTSPLPTIPPGSLRRLLSEAAERDGLSLARVQPDGEAVAIGLEAADPKLLWRWIAQLERSGVVVEKLSVRKGAEETLDAQITFRSGP